MKKNLQRLLGALLAVVLLAGAVPALAAGTGGLNGESGKWADFDESMYDTVTFISTVKNAHVNGFEWPASGTVLLKVSSSTYTLTGSEPNCIGITIPAGLVVDIYKYYQSAGMTEPVYTLLGHFDTTDGNPVTIGSGGSGSSSSGSSSSGSSISEDWGEVNKSFVSGVKSDFYDNSYTDVPSDIWCYDAIMTLTEGGLLNGYGNGKFGPNDNLTRAQVAFVYTRLIGNEVRGSGDLLGYKSYQDNATADRAFATMWLAGNLTRKGGGHSLTEYETSLVKDAGGLAYSISSNGQFGSMWGAVYDNWRASLDGGKDPSTYISSVDDLPDAATIHQWIEENWELAGKVMLVQGTKDEIVKACEDAICRIYNLGMIAGVDSEGTFNPYGTLTRGQMATILWRAGWIEAGCLSYND